MNFIYYYSGLGVWSGTPSVMAMMAPVDPEINVHLTEHYTDMCILNIILKDIHHDTEYSKVGL